MAERRESIREENKENLPAAWYSTTADPGKGRSTQTIRPLISPPFAQRPSKAARTDDVLTLDLDTSEFDLTIKREGPTDECELPAVFQPHQEHIQRVTSRIINICRNQVAPSAHGSFIIPYMRSTLFLLMSGRTETEKCDLYRHVLNRVARCLGAVYLRMGEKSPVNEVYLQRIQDDTDTLLDAPLRIFMWSNHLEPARNTGKNQHKFITPPHVAKELLSKPTANPIILKQTQERALQYQFINKSTQTSYDTPAHQESKSRPLSEIEQVMKGAMYNRQPILGRGRPLHNDPRKATGTSSQVGASHSAPFPEVSLPSSSSYAGGYRPVTGRGMAPPHAGAGPSPLSTSQQLKRIQVHRIMPRRNHVLIVGDELVHNIPSSAVCTVHESQDTLKEVTRSIRSMAKSFGNIFDLVVVNFAISHRQGRFASEDLCRQLRNMKAEFSKSFPCANIMYQESPPVLRERFPGVEQINSQAKRVFRTITEGKQTTNGLNYTTCHAASLPGRYNQIVDKERTRIEASGTQKY